MRLGFLKMILILIGSKAHSTFSTILTPSRNRDHTHRFLTPTQVCPRSSHRNHSVDDSSRKQIKLRIISKEISDFADV